MIEDVLKREGIIAIIRGQYSLAEQFNIAKSLIAGGVNIIEITLNSKYALKAIEQLKSSFPNVIAGAGTVLSRQDVDNAIAAGASFLISPNFDVEVVKQAQKQNTLFISGVFTATEAQAAYKADCKILKLFPADALGPKYLKALNAPLDKISFVPSGGINVNTIESFHRAGAVAFGVGSALVKQVDYMDTKNLNELTKNAHILASALELARANA